MPEPTRQYPAFPMTGTFQGADHDGLDLSGAGRPGCGGDRSRSDAATEEQGPVSGRTVLYALSLGSLGAFVVAVSGDGFGPAYLQIIGATFVVQTVLSALILARREAPICIVARLGALVVLVPALGFLLQP